MNPLMLVTAGVAAVLGVAGFLSAPPDVDTWGLSQPAATAVTIPTTTTESPLGASTSVVPPDPESCPQIYATAPLVGFTEAETRLLARIAWHESRCVERIIGDLHAGGSYGILQIHAPSWCLPNRYWRDGYLQTKGVLDTCEDLYDPAIAVIAARLIVKEGGFEQWTTYGKAAGR